MPPEHSAYHQAESDLYRGWDAALGRFFRKLKTETPVESDPQGAQDRMRNYRGRVEQDLKAFHEKLANIMESDKRGQ